jgi:hypothetical protein
LIFETAQELKSLSELRSGRSSIREDTHLSRSLYYTHNEGLRVEHTVDDFDRTFGVIRIEKWKKTGLTRSCYWEVKEAGNFTVFVVLATLKAWLP